MAIFVTQMAVVLGTAPRRPQMPHTSNAHWAGISSTGLITEGDFARQIGRVISDAFDATDDTNSTVDGRAMEPRAGSVPLAGAASVPGRGGDSACRWARWNGVARVVIGPIG